MGVESYVSPFLGISLPVQEINAGHLQDNTLVPTAMQTKPKKNARKRRKLSGMKRIAATTRERSRIEHLNCAFHTLRSRIPTQPSDVKLTKVETLRLAMSYITHLQKLLDDIENQEKESTGSSEVSSTSKDTRDDHEIKLEAASSGSRVTPITVPIRLTYPITFDNAGVIQHYPVTAAWTNPYTALPVRPTPRSIEPPYIKKCSNKSSKG